MNTCNFCHVKGQVENLALKKCQLEFLEANYLETSLWNLTKALSFGQEPFIPQNYFNKNLII